MSEPALINMVLCVELGTTFDVAAFYHLVCMPMMTRRVITPDKNSKKRFKMPYFKHDGIIVSIRYKGHFRGCRGPIDMHSFGDADLQLDGRNYHFKLAEERLTILGVSDPDKVRNAFNVMIEHIKQVEKNWAPCRSLSDEKIRSTTAWVWNHITISSDPPTIIPSNVDPRFAVLLTLLTNDVTSREEFNRRVLAIQYYMKVPLYQKEPCFERLWICNTVYNFKVPSRLSLYVQAKHLLSLGYKLGHHNIANGKSLIVLVPIAPEYMPEGCSEEEKMHKFTIRDAGTVNQTSPTPKEEAYRVYRQLVQDLGFVPYHDPTILGEKSSKQLEHEEVILKQAAVKEAPRVISTQIQAYLSYVFAL